MVLPGVPRKKSPVTPPGSDPGTVRLVAQCLNHYATPGPTQIYIAYLNPRCGYLLNAFPALKANAGLSIMTARIIQRP